jgi:hypothetical protein
MLGEVARVRDVSPRRDFHKVHYGFCDVLSSCSPMPMRFPKESELLIITQELSRFLWSNYGDVSLVRANPESQFVNL